MNKDFKELLKTFIAVGHDLIDNWDDSYNEYYPNYLPSFDEFISDISKR